jgi:BirA family transcriptional regulator, biotin operon repressor / biotin---[acetyl-CoA-carboxylase] ligase
MLVSRRSFLDLRMGATRFSLLRVLADGEIHSEEQIGTALGSSPVELDRLVEELEALGQRVHRVRGSGYRLAEPLDLYDAQLIADRLGRDFPGLRLELLDECASTNTALAERAAAGAAQGTVLACEHQSAGRGRRGNSWVSTVGGSLTFSILWRFSQGAGALAGLGLAVAVGAAGALEKIGARGVAVKWPNDLFCAGRKLGGILIETSGAAAGPSTVIAGVGINLRLAASARERIGNPATDVASHAAAVPPRAAALAELVVSVAAALERFSREGFAPFRQAWLDRHLWQGRQVVLSQADRRVAEGRVVGIADDGALLLASSKGIERFHNGELSLRLG